MTRPVTSVPTTPPAAAPLHTQQRHLLWLDTLRQRFRRPAPQPLQVSDVYLARRVRHLVQQELAFTAVCQNVTADVEQGMVTLYGSVDTTWRKKRLEALLRTLPGVKHVANHLLAEEELAEQLQHHFQALLTAGTLDRLPTMLVEQQIVELSGEVATPEQRTLVEREVLTVPGVRVVLNHLSVPQEASARVHTTNR
ncbi:MAG TPA: BON domain-containing protein [Ktedonobacterales bacterium]